MGPADRSRSPGAGHRSGRLPQGALPVSGMPWGSNPPYPQPYPRPNLLTSCNLLMYGAPCAAS
jgi:hypothetical protein